MADWLIISSEKKEHYKSTYLNIIYHIRGTITEWKLSETEGRISFFHHEGTLGGFRHGWQFKNISQNLSSLSSAILLSFFLTIKSIIDDFIHCDLILRQLGRFSEDFSDQDLGGLDPTAGLQL